MTKPSKWLASKLCHDSCDLVDELRDHVEDHESRSIRTLKVKAELRKELGERRTENQHLKEQRSILTCAVSHCPYPDCACQTIDILDDRWPDWRNWHNHVNPPRNHHGCNRALREHEELVEELDELRTEYTRGKASFIELEMAEAEAMALVLSHEGHIEKLQNENNSLLKTSTTQIELRVREGHEIKQLRNAVDVTRRFWRALKASRYTETPPANGMCDLEIELETTLQALDKKNSEPSADGIKPKEQDENTPEACGEHLEAASHGELDDWAISATTVQKAMTEPECVKKWRALSKLERSALLGVLRTERDYLTDEDRTAADCLEYLVTATPAEPVCVKKWRALSVSQAAEVLAAINGYESEEPDEYRPGGKWENYHWAEMCLIWIGNNYPIDLDAVHGPPQLSDSTEECTDDD